MDLNSKFQIVLFKKMNKLLSLTNNENNENNEDELDKKTINQNIFISNSGKVKDLLNDIILYYPKHIWKDILLNNFSDNNLLSFYKLFYKYHNYKVRKQIGSNKSNPIYLFEKK